MTQSLPTARPTHFNQPSSHPYLPFLVPAPSLYQLAYHQALQQHRARQLALAAQDYLRAVTASN